MMDKAAFAINGRFLAQKITGVQRYAMNVVLAMDEKLFASGERGHILTPAGVDVPAFKAIDHRVLSPLSGHAWEQTVLPARWSGRLLNLGNTAPVVKVDQVVCIHDTNVLASPESYNRAFRVAYRTLLPALARRAARVATVSQFSARELSRHFGLHPKNIVVLPNGHEHALRWNPAFGVKAIQTLAAESGARARRFVLALGSRAPHKNIGLLVTIADRLDELGIDVVIAGGDAGIFAPEQRQEKSNIKFLGRVSDDDLAFLMGHALCLAFPSWTEGFGLPIIEAMARGCPVVSSDRASMPEVCGDAALMASPADPDAWVDHIRSLLKTPSLREDLIGRGLDRVHAFSWADSAAGYLQLMEDPVTGESKVKAKTEEPMPRLAVVVATRGRPDIVSATVRHMLDVQSLKPAATIVSCSSPVDAGDLAQLPTVSILLGPPGLTAQRNRALEALPNDIDIVVFFDDDFVADAHWLMAAARTFRDCPDMVGMTGHVLADDVKGPGLTFDQAKTIVSQGEAADGGAWVEPYSPYGCNMAFRVSAIGPLRFDERLVLYGWLEDRDFGAAVARHGGRLVKVGEARGVHMGAKSGRVAGERLGYSQIVNPLYLLAKGTMTSGQVADHVFRNMASNLGRAPFPEKHIDRRGRLYGNLKGIMDVMKGQADPERVGSFNREKGR